jgi:hypothetical protein
MRVSHLIVLYAKSICKYAAQKIVWDLRNARNVEHIYAMSVVNYVIYVNQERIQYVMIAPVMFVSQLYAWSVGIKFAKDVAHIVYITNMCVINACIHATKYIYIHI